LKGADTKITVDVIITTNNTADNTLLLTTITSVNSDISCPHYELSRRSGSQSQSLDSHVTLVIQLTEGWHISQSCIC